jgi:arylsulfatase
MTTYPGSSPQWVSGNFDNRPENLGRVGSGVDQGPGWAQASMTPFLYYKGFMSEGGVRSPAVLAGYGVSRKGELHDALSSVRDIYPTVLQYAGVDHPTTFDGRNIVPHQGISMVPFLAGDSEVVRTEDDPYMQELFGGRMIRSGRWKALYMDPPFGPGTWQLFDMEGDLTETKDLGPDNPEILGRLVDRYDAFARDVQIIDPPFTIQDIVAGTYNPSDLVHLGDQ